MQDTPIQMMKTGASKDYFDVKVEGNRYGYSTMGMFKKMLMLNGS